MKKNALISVFRKKEVVEFAKALIELGFNIIASGGTAKVLKEAGIPVKDVAEIVGGGPILGHRVVTLSRKIHAGLLAKDTPQDRAELEGLGIPWIDLVCVDLYPLEKEIKKEGSTPESVIEMTDIGGPTLLRSAAKGRRIVICDPTDRQKVIDWLKAGEPDKDVFLRELAAKAEFIVAQYCLFSAIYNGGDSYFGITGKLARSLRYGENPFQTPSGLYVTDDADPLALPNFKIIEGNPSYMNYCDLDRLLQTIIHITAGFKLNFGKVPFIAIGVKHGNPCGAGVDGDPTGALKKMILGNPRALFGGVVMTNFPITKTEADCLLYFYLSKGEKRRILDGVIAPSFIDEAIGVLKRKESRCLILENPALVSLGEKDLDTNFRFRYVRGGFLLQPNYTFVLDFNHPDLEIIGESLSQREKENLILAWAIGSTSNLNTITIVNGGVLRGIGMWVDRVGAAEMAISQAEANGHGAFLTGAVAYSNSFFPFPDGPEVLAKAGIFYLLTHKGSIRDKEIVEVCQKHGMILVWLPVTYRGFFGH